MMLGFLQPDRGEVLVGRVPLSEIAPEIWRGQVACENLELWDHRSVRFSEGSLLFLSKPMDTGTDGAYPAALDAPGYGRG